MTSMSNNRLYIAAAGAGKTTFLVRHACDLLKEDGQKSICIVTYTIKNQYEIRKRFIEEMGYVPSCIKICGWFDFLLTYCIRPFMGAVIEDLRCRSVGHILVNEISGTFKTKDGRTFKTYKSGDLKKKFLADSKHFYSDKLSEFAFLCYKERMPQFTGRMEAIFSSILIDEVQDLSSWDYSVLSVLLKMDNIHIVMCGDLRQKTYSTTPATKWKNYKGHIDSFFIEKVNTKRRRYVEVDYTTLNYSHRFGKEIADFASLVIGNDFPKTESCKCENCMRRQESYKEEKGVYLVRRNDMSSFIAQYKPLSLIWDRKHNENVDTYTYNYGEVKGMSADVCLIFPTKTIISNFLLSGANNLSELTRSKLYVAVTRARYIAAIVVDDTFDNKKIGLPFWHDKTAGIKSS